jgi:hypothetical protein
MLCSQLSGDADKGSLPQCTPFLQCDLAIYQGIPRCQVSRIIDHSLTYFYYTCCLLTDSILEKISLSTSSNSLGVLQQDISLENIPKIIGGQFMLENEAYVFDISASGPFYYPGARTDYDEQLCEAITTSVSTSASVIESFGSRGRSRSTSRASFSGGGGDKTPPGNSHSFGKTTPISQQPSSASRPINKARAEMETKASVLVSLQTKSLQKFSSLTEQEQELRLQNSGFLRNNAQTQNQLQPQVHHQQHQNGNKAATSGSIGKSLAGAALNGKSQPLVGIDSDATGPYSLSPTMSILLYIVSSIVLLASIACCFVGGLPLLYIFLICISVSGLVSLLPV